MADITRDQAIAQITDGKTPSEARRLIESFDRTVLIQELLSEKLGTPQSRQKLVCHLGELS